VDQRALVKVKEAIRLKENLHEVIAWQQFPPIGRERMLHAIGRAVARTQIQAEWGSDASKGDRRFESSSLQQGV